MKNKRYQSVLIMLTVLLVITAVATGIIVVYSYNKQTRTEKELSSEKARELREKRHNDKVKADKEIEELEAARQAREEAAKAKAEKRRKELEAEAKARKKENEKNEKEAAKKSAKVKSEEKEEKIESSSANGYTVCIDPGHQERGDSSTEAVGPGSSEQKAKVTDGATGVSGVPEYKLNLTIGLLLKDELERRGYKVVMTRTTHDVNISNQARAQIANDAGADISIRLHADSSGGSASGASMLVPSSGNQYVSQYASDAHRLGECIINSYCSKTGFNNRGLSERDDLTGTNWCKMPAVLLEMGFMDNGSDDAKLQDSSLQPVMASSIADGIDDYFGR